MGSHRVDKIRHPSLIQEALIVSVRSPHNANGNNQMSTKETLINCHFDQREKSFFA
jgi:hypothetical protein